MSKYPTPTHDDVRRAREAAGLTQSEAAELVRVGLRTWQDWEHGTARMHPGLWDLFQLRTRKKSPY